MYLIPYLHGAAAGVVYIHDPRKLFDDRQGLPTVTTFLRRCNDLRLWLHAHQTPILWFLRLTTNASCVFSRRAMGATNGTKLQNRINPTPPCRKAAMYSQLYEACLLQRTRPLHNNNCGLSQRKPPSQSTASKQHPLLARQAFP